MPLPVIAGVYRVTLGWTTVGGLNAHNVMHFAGVGSEPDLFAALGANISAEMIESMSEDSGLTSIDILPLDGSSGTVVHTLDGSNDGGVAGAFLVAPGHVISLYTGLAGPRHRGRIFLPFIAEAASADGKVTPAINVTMQTAWDAFLVDMAADDFPLQVASYTHADTEAVTAIDCKLVLGTQRRRVDQLH